MLLAESLFEFHDAILDEGRGMPARVSGETWRDEADNEIVFEGVILFPKDGKFKTNELLKKSVQDYLKKNNITLIKEVNKPISSMLAAMLAVFVDSSGKKVAWLKYFANMSQGGYYKYPETDFTRDTGFSRGKGQAFFETIPIQVSDLINDSVFRPPSQVAKIVLQNAQTLADDKKLDPLIVQHLKELLSAVLGNKPSPILKGGNKYTQIYDKYFGELLAPLSLISGWLSTGDREKSEKALLNGEKFKDGLVSFSTSKNEQLIDSNIILVDAARKAKAKVGVSSKAGSGAAASVRVFAEILRKIKGTPDSKKLQKKYSDMIRIIEIIANKSQYESPLEIAQIFGLISSREADIVRGSKELNLKQFKTVKLTKNLVDIARGFKGVTPQEIKNPEPGYVPFFHMLSAIAKVVVKAINEDQNFDGLIRELLNYSSMVQVNSKVERIGDDCRFVAFNVKWPPDFSGKIVANYNKNYSSSRVRGPIQFRIK